MSWNASIRTQAARAAAEQSEAEVWPWPSCSCRSRYWPAGCCSAAIVAWPIGPDDGTRLWGGALVLALTYAAYLTFCLLLSLAVSVRASTARGALLSLFAIWLMTNLIVPRWAADLAERFAPTPSARAFYGDIAEDEARGMGGLGDRATRRDNLEQATLAAYGVDNLEALPVSYAGISLRASEKHSNLVFDKHFGRLWSIHERQASVHRWAALLSPTLAVRLISMTISGTALRHMRHFADAAEGHRCERVAYLNSDMTQNAAEAAFGYLASEDSWAEAPTFDYTPPPWGSSPGESPLGSIRACCRVSACGWAVPFSTPDSGSPWR